MTSINSQTVPELLTEQEVCERLRLNVDRTPQAQRKALNRIWRAANDARVDQNLPPLRRLRLGSRRYYEPAAVAALIDTLSFEF